MNINFTVIIPARFDSSRLAGKVLLSIAGRSMLQRVYEQALASQASRVLIATDDARIADAARAFDAEVCMTPADCPSGTDRLQAAALHLALPDQQIVVNVQADEPLLPPALIDQVAANLAVDTTCQAATLMSPLAAGEAVDDPHAVKVICNTQGHAIYFSRAAIPYRRDDTLNTPYYRHIGLYAYRVALLHQFVQWGPSALEQVEKLEQLRIIEHGVAIHVAEAVQAAPLGVDTAHDLARIRALFNEKK